MHLIQRPCYQQGSPCQDPAGNQTSEDLLTMVKRCKLQWYGHVSCSSGLAKIILQCTVKGGRRQGRQRNKWEDNIRELTGLEFTKSQRAVENREKWRKLVARSSVVPQRPSQLRDRRRRGKRSAVPTDADSNVLLMSQQPQAVETKC